MEKLPENTWTWRRVLIYIVTIASLVIIAFIAFKNPDYRIAAGLCAVIAIIVSLYIFGANSSYEKLLASTADIIKTLKGE